MPWAADVEFVVRKLLAAIAQPMDIDGYVLNVTATVGAGVFPGDGLDGESLVQRAATALHRAKRHGNRSFERYSAADAYPIASPFLESGLRRAVERGEFVLHYQPIVHLDSRRVCGDVHGHPRDVHLLFFPPRAKSGSRSGTARSSAISAAASSRRRSRS
jgi:predicted signal transduction protein with EAL and GGDEF domain